jgi:hypothetical protein
MGFDSECDVVIEADPDRSDHDEVRRYITSVRDQLVSEHLGVAVGELASAAREGNSLLKAVEGLRGESGKLQPFTEQTVAGEASPLAENDLVDPDHVPPSLLRSVQRFVAGFRY